MTTTPTLQMSPLAYLKLKFMLYKGDTEVGGFGVMPDPSKLYVTDFIMPKQRCSGAYVEFDDDSVQALFDEQTAAGLSPYQFTRVWFHTHPSISPRPSSHDEETFKNSFGECNWAIMAIMARDGTTSCRLRVNKPEVGEPYTIEMPVAWIPQHLTAESLVLPLDAWHAEYAAKVGPMVYETRSKHSTYLDHWNGEGEPPVGLSKKKSSGFGDWPNSSSTDNSVLLREATAKVPWGFPAAVHAFARTFYYECSYVSGGQSVLLYRQYYGTINRGSTMTPRTLRLIDNGEIGRHEAPYIIYYSDFTKADMVLGHFTLDEVPNNGSTLMRDGKQWVYDEQSKQYVPVIDNTTKPDSASPDDALLKLGDALSDDEFNKQLAACEAGPAKMDGFLIDTLAAGDVSIESTEPTIEPTNFRLTTTPEEPPNEHERTFPTRPRFGYCSGE